MNNNRKKHLKRNGGTAMASDDRNPMEANRATEGKPMQRDEVFRLAVFHSITEGSFIDTGIYLFSGRKSAQSVQVHTPRPVFVNSATLRGASSEFDNLLTSGFSESFLSNIFDASKYADQRVSTVDYGYESDSDLEDDDSESDEEDLDKVQEHAEQLRQEKSVQAGARAESEDVRKAGEKSPQENPKQDWDFEKGPAAAGPGLNLKSDLASSASVNTPEKPLSEAGVTTARMGRTVFVQDMAYNTYKALVAYLYTGTVEFAPLRSRTKTDDKEKSVASPAREGHKPPLCSPKSMYRLADKYDLPELKELAVKNIRSQLSPDNILMEMFSRIYIKVPGDLPA